MCSWLVGLIAYLLCGELAGVSQCYLWYEFCLCMGLEGLCVGDGVFVFMCDEWLVG